MTFPVLFEAFKTIINSLILSNLSVMLRGPDGSEPRRKLLCLNVIIINFKDENLWVGFKSQRATCQDVRGYKMGCNIVHTSSDGILERTLFLCKSFLFLHKSTLIKYQAYALLNRVTTLDGFGICQLHHGKLHFTIGVINRL